MNRSPPRTKRFQDPITHDAEKRFTASLQQLTARFNSKSPQQTTGDLHRSNQTSNNQSQPKTKTKPSLPPKPSLLNQSLSPISSSAPTKRQVYTNNGKQIFHLINLRIELLQATSSFPVSSKQGESVTSLPKDSTSKGGEKRPPREEIDHSRSTSPLQPADPIVTKKRSITSLQQFIARFDSTSPQQPADKPITKQHVAKMPSTSGEKQSTKPTKGARKLVKTREEFPTFKTQQQQPDPIEHDDEVRSIASLKLIASFSSTSPQQPTDGNVDFNQRIHSYFELLISGNAGKAEKIKKQLLKSIEGLPGLTADNLIRKAKKLRYDGKYLKAILFFRIAADFYAKKNPHLTVARSVTVRAFEIRDTIELLMEKSDSTFKSKNKKIVRNHVIPLMHDMTRQISDLLINQKIRCEWEVRCLGCIAWSQYYIRDWTSSETTIKRGLELMETKFGNECSKYRIYGTLLNYLGFVCEETSRLEEADANYTKAIEVYRSVRDLTEEDKEERIEKGERYLKSNKAKLDKITNLLQKQ